MPQNKPDPLASLSTRLAINDDTELLGKFTTGQLNNKLSAMNEVFRGFHQKRVPPPRPLIEARRQLRSVITEQQKKAPKK